MRFNNTRVFNFEGAFRGMRNPKDSWYLSDSEFGISDIDDNESDYNVSYEWEGLDATQEKLECRSKWLRDNGILKWSDNDFTCEYAFIGPKDMKLAQTLIRAGSEHRKFMRQIMVSVDITAPLYMWKEFDTYKVGTVANSTSTMHTMEKKPITLESFEIDDMDEIELEYANKTVLKLEQMRLKYLETKDKKYWKTLIRWLPESWLQTRTVTMSYENLLAMCGKGQRRFHKLNEWSGIHTEVEESFIQWARKLPYARDLIFLDELDK